MISLLFVTMNIIDKSKRIYYSNYNYCNNSYKNGLENSTSEENDSDSSPQRL